MPCSFTLQDVPKPDSFFFMYLRSTIFYVLIVIYIALKKFFNILSFKKMLKLISYELGKFREYIKKKKRKDKLLKGLI